VVGVKLLEVVDVEEGDGQRRFPVLALGPEIGEVREEQVWRLEDVELFIVLAGQ
jgi:hypothetical protein